MVNGIEAALGSTFSSDPLSPNSSPLILVISGPSGVGKDAVIKVICHICCICLGCFVRTVVSLEEVHSNLFRCRSL